MNPFKKEIYYISANKLSMGINCPFKLYLNLCHVQPKHFDNKYTSAGSAVHKYMEDMFTEGAHDFDYYVNGMYQPEENRPLYVVPEEMYDRVKTCISNGTKWFNGYSFDCEKPFNVELETPKGRKVMLNGFIDAINDEVIYDWKTGKKVTTKDDYKRQAAVYYYVAEPKRKVIFKSLLDGSEFTVTKQHPNYIPSLCDQYIDRLEMHEFDRNINALCRFCEFRAEYCYSGAEYDYFPLEIHELIKR